MTPLFRESTMYSNAYSLAISLSDDARDVRNRPEARSVAGLVAALTRFSLIVAANRTDLPALAVWSGVIAVARGAWSHSDEAPRFRVVVPFARVVRAATKDNNEGPRPR